MKKKLIIKIIMSLVASLVSGCGVQVKLGNKTMTLGKGSSSDEANSSDTENESTEASNEESYYNGDKNYEHVKWFDNSVDYVSMDGVEQSTLTIRQINDLTSELEYNDNGEITLNAKISEDNSVSVPTKGLYNLGEFYGDMNMEDDVHPYDGYTLDISSEIDEYDKDNFGEPENTERIRNLRWYLIEGTNLHFTAVSINDYVNILINLFAVNKDMQIEQVKIGNLDCSKISADGVNYYFTLGYNTDFYGGIVLIGDVDETCDNLEFGGYEYSGSDVTNDDMMDLVLRSTYGVLKGYCYTKYYDTDYDAYSNLTYEDRIKDADYSMFRKPSNSVIDTNYFWVCSSAQQDELYLLSLYNDNNDKIDGHIYTKIPNDIDFESNYEESCREIMDGSNTSLEDKYIFDTIKTINDRNGTQYYVFRSKVIKTDEDTEYMYFIANDTTALSLKLNDGMAEEEIDNIIAEMLQ